MRITYDEAKTLERANLGCGCFPGDTGVMTPHGLVAIASLHVGDEVLAEDPSTGKVEPEKVQAVIDDGIQPLMQVRLSEGSRLSVTTDHPFYVDSGPGITTPGWVQAGDLQVGDRIRTDSGRDVTVGALRYHIGQAHVYTLTVGARHDFFVGTAGVLAHNCDPNRIAKLAKKLSLNPNSEPSKELLNNLDMTVNDFISKYRNAGIRKVFPKEYLDVSVETALIQGGSTVRKLLTNNRWRKL